MRKTAGLVASLAILASALLGAPTAQAAAGDITGEGSSFAGAILKKCATDYRAAFPSQGLVTYTDSNSQGGKDAFRLGTKTFGASDFAYTGSNGDDKPTGAMYVPVTSGPIAIMYNLAGIVDLKITPQVLAKIYKGTITSWDDNEITSLQSLANKSKLNALTTKTITPAYRTAGSGTSDNFSGYLKATTSNFNQSSDWAVATGDATPKGNSYSKGSLLKAGVVATPGSIGYADLKDALTGVQIAALRNEAGQFWKADAARALTFLSTQDDVQTSGNVKIDWTKSVNGGYNASLFTYAIVKTDNKVKPTVGVSVEGANLKKFLGYVLSTCGPAVSKGLGYSQISGAVRTKALATVNYIK
ncbi:MAG: hypothetical protein EBY26_02575 [Microbacteriaceae bacterium]|nr:hypothetical protein [Microbacteriaceae bacterium]